MLQSRILCLCFRYAQSLCIHLSWTLTVDCFYCTRLYVHIGKAHSLSGRGKNIFPFYDKALLGLKEKDRSPSRNNLAIVAYVSLFEFKVIACGTACNYKVFVSDDCNQKRHCGFFRIAKAVYKG